MEIYSVASIIGPPPSPEDSGVANSVPSPEYSCIYISVMLLLYHVRTVKPNIAHIQYSMDFITLPQWAPWLYVIGQHTQGYKGAQQWDICKLLPSYFDKKIYCFINDSDYNPHNPFIILYFESHVCS